MEGEGTLWPGTYIAMEVPEAPPGTYISKFTRHGQGDCLFVLSAGMISFYIY
jgi:hypothetical protein